MFNTIILLAEPLEEGTLSATLLRHNPHLTLHAAVTLDDLNAINPRTLKRARLLSFASSVIVPRRILDAIGYGAFNFHPGPPNYPGWAPAYFAARDRVTIFGVTAHVMHERVDSGPIIALDMFEIPAAISGERLEAMAYAHMTRQFFKLAKRLATSRHAPPLLPAQWCGRKNTRRDLVEPGHIATAASRKDLDRHIAGLSETRLGVIPTLALESCQIRHRGLESTPLKAAANVAKATEPAAAARQAQR